ncbi:hypothetical protein AB4144_47820, partial [Rhizobiaceae sp. 2RAB30]
IFAIPHHCHAIGNAFQFVHLVRNVDDAHAFGLQLRDDGKKLVDLGVVEGEELIKPVEGAVGDALKKRDP